MILYKLTDQKHETRNRTKWGPGISHSGTGKGPLCSQGYIHAYLSAELAMFLNPIHADFFYPRLYEAEGEIALNDRNLKVGCVTLTTIREIPAIVPTRTQLTAFGLLCAKQVCDSPDWLRWAESWLSGKDRSAAAAYDAYDAYDAYTTTAAYDAYDAYTTAARAARAARDARAARAARAARDAYDACDAYDAYYATDAAYYATDAAYHAADAADAATSLKPLDLVSIAKEAMMYE